MLKCLECKYKLWIHKYWIDDSNEQRILVVWVGTCHNCYQEWTGHFTDGNQYSYMTKLVSEGLVDE